MYEFKGKHYIASLYDVKEITNLDKLRNVFTAAIKESGATILGKTEHVFSDTVMVDLPVYGFCRRVTVPFILMSNKKAYLWTFFRAGKDAT